MFVGYCSKAFILKRQSIKNLFVQFSSISESSPYILISGWNLQKDSRDDREQEEMAMAGKLTALSLVLVLALSLTACSAKTERNDGTAAGRLSNQGTSEMRKQNLMEDGQYYAGADGEVSKKQHTGESEWEKLGRELRESWDRMMDGTEETAQDLERAAENAAKDAESGIRNQARSMK